MTNTDANERSKRDQELEDHAYEQSLERGKTLPRDEVIAIFRTANRLNDAYLQQIETILRDAFRKAKELQPDPDFEVLYKEIGLFHWQENRIDIIQRRMIRDTLINLLIEEFIVMRPGQWVHQADHLILALKSAEESARQQSKHGINAA